MLEPLLADYVVLPLMVACVTLPFYALMQMQDGIARSYNWVQLALMPMYPATSSCWRWWAWPTRSACRPTR